MNIQYGGIVVLHSVISNEKKIDKPYRKTKTKAHGSFNLRSYGSPPSDSNNNVDIYLSSHDVFLK
jgi:hypothetical protein